jgi:hypothetical protein
MVGHTGRNDFLIYEMVYHFARNERGRYYNAFKRSSEKMK